MSTLAASAHPSLSRTSTEPSREIAGQQTALEPWCYVDNAHSSSCQDKRFSARFPNNPWSYEACATPLPVAVGPIAPSAAFTAPVGPSYGQNIPSYGHPASGPISSGFGSSGYGSGYGSGFGSGYGSAGSLYGSNLGTLQPYGEIIPKSSSDKDAVKF